MSIPLKLLENLKCSECHKFLSATPVRVYASKEIKCARCSKENDGGVISKLYAEVVNYLKFPCVNHQDGCQQLLSHIEVINHEKACIKKSYNCPLCYEFFSAFTLEAHIKQNHAEAVLTKPEFIVRFDNEHQEYLHFYFQDSILAAVVCKYDTNTQTLKLKIGALGINPSRNIKYKLSCHDAASNILFCQSKFHQCGKFDSIRDEENFHIESGVTGKTNSVTCAFNIIETPYLIIHSPKSLLNQLSNKASFIQTLEKITTKTQLNQELTFYRAKIFLSNMVWVIVARKHKSLEQHFLSIMFCCLKEYCAENMKYKVLANFNLLSCNPHLNYKVNQCNFIFDKTNDSWSSLTTLQWETFIHPENGFIHNNCIRIGLNIEIESSEKKKSLLKRCACAQQSHCKRLCI